MCRQKDVAPASDQDWDLFEDYRQKVLIVLLNADDEEIEDLIPTPILPQLPKALAEYSDNLARLLENPNLIFEQDFKFDPNIKPTEEQIKEIIEATAGVAAGGTSAYNISMWVLGNIAALVENYDVDWSHVLEQSHANLSTINAARRTFQYFSQKRYKVSFAHHREVAHMRDMTDETKHQLMQLIEDETLSITQMRNIAHQLRAQFRANPKEVDLEVAVKEANKRNARRPKPQFLRISESGSWELTADKPATADGDLLVEVGRVVKKPKA